MSNLDLEEEIHSSYDPFYFTPLFAIEDKHFWFRARNKIIITLVKQIIAGFNTKYKVIEIGCGTGNVLKELEITCQPASLFGMDLFMEGLSYAKLRVNCPLLQGDLHNSPFNTKFDLIGLFDVIEHLPDDIKVLNDLRTMLVPGGALILTVPAHPALWSYFDTASHHFRRYRLRELTIKLEQTGYDIEYITQYMAIIFPLVWVGRRLSILVSRLKKNSQQQTQKLAENELRIIPLINDLLLRLLSWEVHFIKRRFHLPIGTSMIVVARNRTFDKSLSSVRKYNLQYE